MLFPTVNTMTSCWGRNIENWKVLYHQRIYHRKVSLYGNLHIPISLSTQLLVWSVFHRIGRDDVMLGVCLFIYGKRNGVTTSAKISLNAKFRLCSEVIDMGHL